MSVDTPQAPLSGLRVIEVSSFVAAPLGGMTLAQLGADVIRIDPIGGAADQQRWPLSPSGTSLYWSGLNKGKRSMAVNMRTDEGRDIVRGLVAACPRRTAVVLTNAVARPWLSHETLSQVCPDLIHVQVQGHHNGDPAVDYTVNAAMGFPMVTGPADHTDPINHVLPAWDIACGLYAALGVTAAARRRDRTGLGEQAQIALADVALAMAGNLGFLAEAQLNSTPRQRIGNYLYGGFARDFTCADQTRLMVVALTSRHWRDLVEVTELQGPVGALEEAMGADFSTERDRFEYREVLAALFQRWFSGQTAADVSSKLSRTSLMWAPYRTFGGAIEHLQTDEGANPMVTEIDQPGVGTYLAPGSPLNLAAWPGQAEPAPVLGQDTTTILADELGLDAVAIDALSRAGTVSGTSRTGDVGTAR